MAGDRSAYAIAAFFTSAGISHFAKPDFFEAIVPDWIPDAALANKVSGAAEIAFGAAMIPRSTRRFAAGGLLILLTLVFPANVDMAIKDVDVKPDEDGALRRVEGAGTGARNWIRLPLQFVMMALVRRHLRGVGVSSCGAAPSPSAPRS